jgi:hypothetical protein
MTDTFQHEADGLKAYNASKLDFYSQQSPPLMLTVATVE